MFSLGCSQLLLDAFAAHESCSLSEVRSGFVPVLLTFLNLLFVALRNLILIVGQGPKVNNYQEMWMAIYLLHCYRKQNIYRELGSSGLVV